MKVLLINKFHYLKDGASRSYFETARLLEAAGHEVAFFSMRHPDNRPTAWDRYFIDRIDYNAERISWRKKLRLAIKLIYNREAQDKLQRLIDEFQPDIAHLHIVYHQLSPGIIRLLKRNGIPVVLTLHDYKVICPNYNVFHRGAVSWRGCGGRYWQVIVDRSIKNSYAKSALAALEAYIHGTWLKTYGLVDRFIAPSRFMREVCVRYGLPAEKITVIPHAAPQLASEESGSDISEDALPAAYVLYAGRLAPEKGVMTFLEALSLMPVPINAVIAGDGPQRAELEAYVREHGLVGRVRFTGNLGDRQLARAMRRARAVVIPSVWPEVFGYVALEAFTHGVPVVAARAGGLAEVVAGAPGSYLFEPGDREGLAERLQAAHDPQLAVSPDVLREYVRSYSTERHSQALLQVYRELSTADPLTNQP